MSSANITDVSQKRKFDEFVENNLGLVHLCANRFKNKGIDYDDLYSAGCIGLIKAARGFDDSRGLMFSTYAVPVILGEIKRLFREGGSIKVSRTVKELSLRVKRTCDNYIKLHGHEPSVNVLAELCGCSVYEITQALEVSKQPIYIYDDNENGTCLEIPVDAPDKDIGDMIALRQIYKSLDDTDKRIIQLRYFKELTQSKTADILGMTQVQISRREKKILKYMRDQMLK